MSARLLLETCCDGCGGYGRIDLPETERGYLEGSGQAIQCPTCGGSGGSVVVLDPEKELFVAYSSGPGGFRIKVKRILRALTEGKN